MVGWGNFCGVEAVGRLCSHKAKHSPSIYGFSSAEVVLTIFGSVFWGQNDLSQTMQYYTQAFYFISSISPMDFSIYFAATMKYVEKKTA